MKNIILKVSDLIKTCFFWEEYRGMVFVGQEICDIHKFAADDLPEFFGKISQMVTISLTPIP
jgi:hypothetical protein